MDGFYGLDPNKSYGLGFHDTSKVISAWDNSLLTTGTAGSGAGGGFMSGFAKEFASMGPWLAIAGAVQGAIGTYYQAQTQKYQLESQKLSMEYQSSISQINARQAEFQANNILLAGERAIGQLTLKYGKALGSSRASMASRGVVLNEGSAAELEASHELTKQNDILTINANSVRQAEEARIRGVNYANQGAMQAVSANNLGISASSISPFTAASTSLLGGATSIAGSFVTNKRLEALLERANA